MKIYSCLVLILFFVVFSSCKKESDPSALDGRYTGIVVSVRKNWTNDQLTFESRDTLSITLEIENNRFSKASNWPEDCQGSITIQGQTIDFIGENCACSCNCLPISGCLGDIILGTYDFKLTNNQLKMLFEEEQENTISGDSFKFFLSEEYDLNRN